MHFIWQRIVLGVWLLLLFRRSDSLRWLRCWGFWTPRRRALYGAPPTRSTGPRCWHEPRCLRACRACRACVSARVPACSLECLTRVRTCRGTTQLPVVAARSAGIGAQEQFCPLCVQQRYGGPLHALWTARALPPRAALLLRRKELAGGGAMLPRVRGPPAVSPACSAINGLPVVWASRAVCSTLALRPTDIAIGVLLGTSP